MNVSKVKLGRNSATVEYRDAFGNSITHKGEFPPHNDLVSAIDRLTDHFCSLTEQADVVPMNADDYTKAPDFSEVTASLSVTSVQVKAGENGDKATIFGYRVLSTGRNLQLKTPPVSLDDDDYYANTDELSAAIDGVFAEAEAYVEGKHGDFSVKEKPVDDEPVDDPFAE